MCPVAEDIRATAAERSWRWPLAIGDVQACVQQPPSVETQANTLRLSWNTASIIRAEWEWGQTSEFGSIVPAERSGDDWQVVVEGLAPRGQDYFGRLTVWQRQGKPWHSPTLSYRTLVRYPYGYRFSLSDPRLRHHPGDPKVFTHRSQTEQSPEPVDRLLGDTCLRSYLEHIVLTFTRPEMTPMQKVVALWTFLGTAVVHHPLYLPPLGHAEQVAARDYWDGDYDREAVLALEMHMGRCGQTNTFIGKSLFRLADLELVSYPPPSCHCAAKIEMDGRWYFVDLDGWKAGCIPLTGDGEIPELEWIYQYPNFYLLDCYPSWQEVSGEWVLAADGTRCTGDICTSGFTQMGYASCFYGAPMEFPPSIPIPLPVRFWEEDRPVLEWSGSYDPDDDFRDYIVEVGNEPTLSDIGVYRTEETSLTLPVPIEDRIYWRVRATDRHAELTAYKERIFFESSKEACVEIADVDSPRKSDTRHLPPPRKYHRSDFVLDLAQGDLGGFSRMEGWDDYYGNGSIFRTDLYNLSYGREGCVLHLADWSNKWLSGSAVRSLWCCPVENAPGKGEPFGFDVVLRCERSDIAGEHRFPTISLTHASDPSAGVGLIIDPARLTILPGHKTWGQWWSGIEETRNGGGIAETQIDGGWRHYRFLFVPEERRLTLEVDNQQLFRIVLPPTQGWDSFVPNRLCIASNPDAEALWNLAELAVFRYIDV